MNDFKYKPKHVAVKKRNTRTKFLRRRNNNTREGVC